MIQTNKEQKKLVLEVQKLHFAKQSSSRDLTAEDIYSRLGRISGRHWVADFTPEEHFICFQIDTWQLYYAHSEYVNP